MAEYDYKKGKERVEAILDNELTVIEQGELPKDDAFTFSNGYYSWVSGIFVDIRKSSELFAEEDKEKVSKIIRSSVFIFRELCKVFFVNDGSPRIKILIVLCTPIGMLVPFSILCMSLLIPADLIVTHHKQYEVLYKALV